MKILTEAAGCLCSAYLIKAIRSAGYQAVACDCNDMVAAKYLADFFFQVPKGTDDNYWDFMLRFLEEEHIHMMLPTLDETLWRWAQLKNELHSKGIVVVLSNADTIYTCQDKWLCYLFFEKYHIPTPLTSLDQHYRLIKPRRGRGSSGIFISDDKTVDMTDCISQELLRGQEVTIDVFCNNYGDPIYIVPRKRTRVVSGKSIDGEVFHSDEITRWIKEICKYLHFVGPINVQCFMDPEKGIQFTEINPRMAGGMALGFAATQDNWVQLMVDHFVLNKQIVPKPIRYGMRMMRYYDEVFVS